MLCACDKSRLSYHTVSYSSCIIQQLRNPRIAKTKTMPYFIYTAVLLRVLVPSFHNDPPSSKCAKRCRRRFNSSRGHIHPGTTRTLTLLACSGSRLCLFVCHSSIETNGGAARYDSTIFPWVSRRFNLLMVPQGYREKRMRRHVARLSSNGTYSVDSAVMLWNRSSGSVVRRSRWMSLRARSERHRQPNKCIIHQLNKVRPHAGVTDIL